MYYVIGDGKEFFAGFYNLTNDTNHMVLDSLEKAWKFETLEEAQEWMKVDGKDGRLPLNTGIYRLAFERID